jgi:tRNA A-37 threonylcarbamoyl transferase component Bud32
MGSWKRLPAQCLERLNVLRASWCDNVPQRPPAPQRWMALLGIFSALLILNPFALAYFLVNAVSGNIPVSTVQVYNDSTTWNLNWYTYYDLRGHYHTSYDRPIALPWTHFSDQRLMHLHPASSLTEPKPQPAGPIVSSQPQPPAPHPRSKLTLEDWRTFSRALDPHLKTTAALGLLLFLIARRLRRRYVFHNDLGLSISYSPNTQIADAALVPWQCIKRVRVGEKTSSFLLIETDHGTHEYLRWHDIITCIEPGEFINALRTWAPHAVHDCKFPTENTSLNKVDEHTYTKLWFKYYSTGTERQRPGQLTAEEELQDGRFKIVERLGSGGQGTAYVAIDQSGLARAGTEIVLKEYILPVHRGEQVMEQSAKRLRQEAEILQKIDHPNIVKLLDEFTEDHRGYLVMEYVRGTQLKALVAQEGPQPEATVRELALQICDILDYLHSMDPPIIHRDLTPDNLILQNDGNVKLVDFNVAHQLESVATATVVGKHAYIPPEQFRGKPTPQSDIYALGCTMHFLLTGQEPEPLTVSRPRLLNEAVSEQLNQIIATCTNMDASKRFATVGDVRDALAGTNDQPNAGTSSTSESATTIKLTAKVEA